MNHSSVKKIAIIGNAGSGKTTLAFELSKKLNLPLYHLDQYYWKPNWERSTLDEFCTVHDALCARDAWIIEGSYYRFLSERVACADVIIYLDLPRYLCIWRVVKRALLNPGAVIPGNPEGCTQRIFSLKFLDFLRWIWNFNTRYRKTILDALVTNEIVHRKRVVILESTKEITTFVQELTQS